MTGLYSSSTFSVVFFLRNFYIDFLVTRLIYNPTNSVNMFLFFYVFAVCLFTAILTGVSWGLSVDLI
jgi:hypothetical protein